MKTETIKIRADSSERVLKTLKNLMYNKLTSIKSTPEFMVFAAGSYGRLEASEHSDIDLFFIANGNKNIKESYFSNLAQIEVFANFININKDVDFPEFSNDGKYLKIIYSDDLINNLGDQQDDWENTFTARMLLLLESRPFYNEALYKEIKSKVIETYLRDYPGHEHDFAPRFLINDIMRYWYTLCTGYEKGRHFLKSVKELGISQEEKDKRQLAKNKFRVKNYKLKFSRKMTVIATFIPLIVNNTPVTNDEIKKIFDMTTIDRLVYVQTKCPSAELIITNILLKYSNFLQNTNLSKDSIRKLCQDDNTYSMLMEQAREFGKEIDELIKHVCLKREIDASEYVL